MRGRIGGGLPWYQEFERYALLLTPGDVQGAIGRRAAVLATLLAVVGLAWVLAGRRRSGIAAGPARRLLVTLGLSAVAMMVSPTKWTQHFGALTGPRNGGAHPGARRLRPPRPRGRARPETARRRHLAGLAAATVVCGLVLAGQNMWPFVSGWYTPTFSTVPPLVGTVPVATIVLVLGGAVVVPLLAWSVWRRSAQIPGGPTRPRAYRNAETAYQNAELLRFCTRAFRRGARRGRARRRAGVAGARPGAGRGGPRRRLHPRLGRAGDAAGRPVRAAVGVAGRDRPRRRRPPGRAAADRRSRESCPPPPFLRPHPSTSTRAGPRCPASPWPAPARRPGTPSIPGSATACCPSSSP